MQYRQLTNLVSIAISLGCAACAPQAGSEVAASQSISENLGRAGTHAVRGDVSAAESGDESRRYRAGRQFRQAQAGTGAAGSQGSRRWRGRAEAGAGASAAAGAPATAAIGGGAGGAAEMEAGAHDTGAVPSQPGAPAGDASTGSSDAGTQGSAPSQPEPASGGSSGSAEPGAGTSAPASSSAGAGGSGSPTPHGSNSGGSAGAGTSSSSAQPAGGSAAPAPASSTPSQPTAARWSPAPSSTWQIQYEGGLDTSVDANVWDIDLYDTSAATIAGLHAAGRKVICYLDTAYEPNRPDSAQLAPYRGQPIDGWPGQYWVDVRQPAVLDVMRARIALAADKGCDAIDADDVDVRSNDSGFSISAAEQQSFVIALADAAHARGMAYGMKNALEDVSALVSHVDFAVNEQCFEYNECDALRPFAAAGKAVFNIEYADGSLADKGASICPQASKLGFSTLIKRLSLNAERFSCR